MSVAERGFGGNEGAGAELVVRGEVDMDDDVIESYTKE